MSDCQLLEPLPIKKIRRIFEVKIDLNTFTDEELKDDLKKLRNVSLNSWSWFSQLLDIIENK
jgi:hypothetical protein